MYTENTKKGYIKYTFQQQFDQTKMYTKITEPKTTKNLTSQAWGAKCTQKVHKKYMLEDFF